MGPSWCTTGFPVPDFPGNLRDFGDEQVGFYQGGMSQHAELDPIAGICLSLKKRDPDFLTSMGQTQNHLGGQICSQIFPFGSFLGDLQIPAVLGLGFTFPWDQPGIPSRIFPFFKWNIQNPTMEKLSFWWIFPQISQFFQQQMMMNIWMIPFFPTKFPSEEPRENPHFLGLLKIYIQGIFTQIKFSPFHFSAAFPFIFFPFLSIVFYFQSNQKPWNQRNPANLGIQWIWGLNYLGFLARWRFLVNSLLVQLFKIWIFLFFFFFAGISQCLWSAPGWSMGTWGSSPWPGWKTLGHR